MLTTERITKMIDIPFPKVWPFALIRNDEWYIIKEPANIKNLASKEGIDINAELNGKTIERPLSFIYVELLEKGFELDEGDFNKVIDVTSINNDGERTFQSDYTGTKAEVIDTFLEHCKARKVKWANLFNEATGELIQSYKDM
jgi:hypothetical protein